MVIGMKIRNATTIAAMATKVASLWAIGSAAP